MVSDGSDGGDFGGAADLIGGGAGGGEAVGADAGAGADPGAGASGDGASGGGDAGGGDGGVGGAAPPDWYNQLSADPAEGDSASLRDWVESVGVKDLNGLAKIARDNQRALRDSGRVKVPGEDASAEEIAAYHKAIGVPEDPKGYAIPAPKDADGNEIPLNSEVLERVTQLAHKHGVPAGSLNAVLEEMVQADIADMDARKGELEKAAADHVKSWGENRDERLAQINAAAKDLNLTRADMEFLRGMPGGVGKALDMLAKFGANFTEDSLVRGQSRSFGMTASQAHAELETFKSDPALREKAMVPGSAENKRYQRALEAAGAAADKAAAQS